MSSEENTNQALVELKMTYKLTYFDCAALGEPLRFLLKYGNIDFEDVRIKNEDWPQLKPSEWCLNNFPTYECISHFYFSKYLALPMGTLPLLEVDGKKMYQSISILRLLAKKLGLSGSTDLENFEIDQIVDTVVDLRESKYILIRIGIFLNHYFIYIFPNQKLEASSLILTLTNSWRQRNWKRTTNRFYHSILKSSKQLRNRTTVI